jgi:hypothetical protein
MTWRVTLIRVHLKSWLLLLKLSDELRRYVGDKHAGWLPQLLLMRQAKTYA